MKKYYLKKAYNKKIFLKMSLNLFDRKIYNFLSENVKIMPQRFIKFIAYYYTDARIRKKYFKKLNVFLGEGTYSNIGLIADATKDAKVMVGKNVSIAPYVTFITVSEPNNSKSLKNNSYLEKNCIKEKMIVVEDDVWIGTNVTILPGVTIGTHSVIGANSLVIDDVEPYGIYAGTPAKKIRTIKE